MNPTGFRRAALVAALTFFAVLESSAQVPAPGVQWTATATPDPTDITGHRATLSLIGVVPDGWHVYALSQLPGGPSPLQVTLAPDGGARLRGAASGTVPEKRHDPSFDLDTEFYTATFNLKWPLDSRRSLNGVSSLPVSVRFQLCSERECQPPKTVRLQAVVAAL